jgi:hypothetical protein
LNAVPDRQQTCQNQANARDQHPDHHRTHPQQPGLEPARAAYATIPTYYA